MSSHHLAGHGGSTSKQSRSRARGRLCLAVSEALEQRRLLTVAAAWQSGISMLEVYESAAGTDSVTVSVNAGNVEVRNSGSLVTISGAATLAASSVKEIRLGTGANGDTIDVSGVTTGSFTNLTQGVYLSGGPGDDTVTGSPFGDVIEGGAGNDTIDGGAGADAVNGDDGNDTLAGSDGDDVVNGDGFGELTQSANNMTSPSGVTLDEASGLQVGRSNTDVIFTIEDSNNAPNLFANNLDGTSRGYYTFPAGPTNVDWEDLGAYYDSGAGKNYFYVADIGDNARSRSNVKIYKIEEPTSVPNNNLNHGSVTLSGTLTLQYPSGIQRDAEALFVDPATGDIHIVSKREAAAGLSHLYTVTSANITWDNVSPITLTDLGAINIAVETPSVNSNYAPSGAGISPNGLDVALRSDFMIYVFSRASTSTSIDEMLTGTSARVVAAPNLRETPTENRESVAFDGTGTTLYTVTETGGKVNSYSRSTTGSDTVSGGAGADQLAGGAGTDTATYDVSGTGAVNVSLANGAASADGFSSTDTLSTLEDLVGGPSGDTLEGDNNANTIRGGAGNDFIWSRGGADTIYGGLDNDNAYGGLDNDSMYGEGGDDTLYGGDISGIASGDGNDTLVGGDGSDSFRWPGNNQGNDSVVELDTDGDVDELYFVYLDRAITFDLGSTASQAVGDTGHVTLSDNDSFEAIVGTQLNDYITGNTLNNVLGGYTGNDTYYIKGSAIGADQIWEATNGGTDWVDFTLFTAGAVTFSLATTAVQQIGTNASNTIQIAYLDSLENIRGSFQSNDCLTGDGRANNLVAMSPGATLIGGAGDDLLTGSAYGDTMYGGDGSDTMLGYGGNDTEYGEAGNDYAYGGYGNDYIDGGNDSDYVWGDDSNDNLYGGAGNDYVYGGYGDDYLNAGSGNDYMWGQDGNDSFYSTDGVGGNDWMDGGTGTDSILGMDSGDAVYNIP